MKRFGFVLCALVAAACGGSPAPAPETQSPEGGAAAGGAPQAWSAMNADEKGAFMASDVIPKMGELFKPENPDFGCATCHGANMADVGFKMPNTLAPLDPANMPFGSADGKTAKTAAWMKSDVTPRMAGLLGAPVYDPDTKQGFGCFGCHAMAKAQ